MGGVAHRKWYARLQGPSHKTMSLACARSPCQASRRELQCVADSDLVLSWYQQACVHRAAVNSRRSADHMQVWQVTACICLANIALS